MQFNQSLLELLRGCLNPQTVQACEHSLQERSLQHDFTSELLQLIPRQEHQLLIMVMSTLKNYLLAHYNDPLRPISQSQKALLRDNILNLYYEISSNGLAVNLYKEILHIVIAVDYPWNGVHEIIEQDLSSNIVAAAYFFRQVCKVFQWLNGTDRIPLEQFITQYFPKMEALVERVLSNYNEATANVLEQLLKGFYSAFYIEIPHYLRNFQSLQKWILYCKTILDAPPDLGSTCPRIASTIYLRLLSYYCLDQADGKQYAGWAGLFRSNYAQGLYQHCLSKILGKQTREEVTSVLLNCLHEVVKNNELRKLVREDHLNILIYQHLLPMIQSTNQEKLCFLNSPIDFLRMEDNLVFHEVRRAAIDVLERILTLCSYGQKTELIKFVEYAASVLGQPTSTDGQNQIILRALTKLKNPILKNKFLKTQFEQLTVRFFVPLLKVPHPLLNSLVCALLATYLPFVKLSDPTVHDLMALIYESMTNSASLVLKHYSIMGFTALLGHTSARQAARPFFRSILEIYVKVQEQLDHEALMVCLESIVTNFSEEIVAFAPDLLNHLVKMFYSLSRKKDQEDDDEEADNNVQVTAALSTVKQILTCHLPDEVYINVSVPLTEILVSIFGDFSRYFDEVLSLFNVLVFHAKCISDFQTPYVLCFKLLENKNKVVEQSSLPHPVKAEIMKADRADSEFQESLLSILKNLIQKMPIELLAKFDLPIHPQLLLSLIQNKRITKEALGMLNLASASPLWLSILQSYTCICYEVGQVSPASQVKAIPGLSLFPWLKERFGPTILKQVMNVLEEEDKESDEEEENTMQLLQRYANQEEEEEEEFVEGSGMNYGYLYTSPFDSSKDKEYTLFQLKSLSPPQLSLLTAELPPRYRRILQTIFP